VRVLSETAWFDQLLIGVRGKPDYHHGGADALRVHCHSHLLLKWWKICLGMGRAAVETALDSHHFMSTIVRALAIGAFTCVTACSARAHYRGDDYAPVVQPVDIATYDSMPDGHERIGFVMGSCPLERHDSFLFIARDLSPCGPETLERMKETAAQVGGTGILDLKCTEQEDDAVQGAVDLECVADVIRPKPKSR